MYDLIHIVCIILFEVLWPEHGRNLTKTPYARSSTIWSSLCGLRLDVIGNSIFFWCCQSLILHNLFIASTSAMLFINAFLQYPVWELLAIHCKDPMLVAMFLPSTRRLGLVLEGGIRSIFRRTETSQTSWTNLSQPPWYCWWKISETTNWDV